MPTLIGVINFMFCINYKRVKVFLPRFEGLRAAAWECSEPCH